MAQVCSPISWKAAYPQLRRKHYPNYYNSKSYRFVRDNLNTINSKKTYLSYLKTGTDWGVLLPNIYLSDLSSQAANILSIIGMPLQMTALLVNLLSLEKLFKGKDKELSTNGNKLARLLLSIGTGFLKILQKLGKLGLFSFAAAAIWRMSLLATLGGLIGSLLSFYDDVISSQSIFGYFYSSLALSPAILAFYLFFQVSFSLNITYLTLSTLILFLNGLEIEKYF